MNILSKIMFFILFMSILNISRHGWKILMELRKEEPQKIEYSKSEILFLGFSFSYILSVLFTME